MTTLGEKKLMRKELANSFLPVEHLLKPFFFFFGGGGGGVSERYMKGSLGG